MLDNIANISPLSKRTLQRRFKSATQYNFVDYVQKVKIEVAKKLIENKDSTISEIMFDVGYIDPKAFREVFKKHTGLSPTEYKNRIALIQ